MATTHPLQSRGIRSGGVLHAGRAVLPMLLIGLTAGCDPAGPPGAEPEGSDAGPLGADAGPLGADAGPLPPGVDAGRPAPGTDAGQRPDAGDPGSDAGPATGAPLDCSGFATTDHALCAETADACEIVFYDGSGCPAACASAGMECAESHQDHDDSGPRCERHPSGESFGCADTGHRSDYCVCRPRQRAFEGAEGFGAFAEGGRGGVELTVTNLNDSGEGSLRWAVERSGRRIVHFAVDGVITLRSALRIHDPYITIDGRGALDPGEQGITIRDYPIDIRTHDVVIRYLRVRLGDVAVLRRVAASGRDRPTSSADLDCINIHQSRDVIIDHVSASWSTDEIFSITNSRNVTVQWSILSEPIANPRTHPYGDAHAFAANNSAATLTYHHNLFAHFRFRGPQFEANDMQGSSPPFDAKFEAVNNVVYGYTSSGSRYRTGFERSSDRVTSVDFLYHFVGNRYVSADRGRSEIMADTSYGTERNIRLHVRDNIGPHRTSASADQLALVFTDSGADDPLRRDSRALSQHSDRPLFESPAPVRVQPAESAHDDVLDDAGCSIERDAIDRRVVEDVRRVAPARIISSQEDVPGGWPSG